MEIQDKIQNLIKEALVKLDIKSEVSFAIEHPADMKMGDYSTNVAMGKPWRCFMSEAFRQE
jgi:arginyl-tRNA synthetase